MAYYERNKRVGDVVKSYRKDRFTQTELALESDMSRSGYADQENGKVLMSNHVGKAAVRMFGDPFMPVEMAQALTGVGPVYLDGENVDLHRSSVKEKTLKELRDALDHLEENCLAKPLSNLNELERTAAERTIMELAEAKTALTHMISVLCKELNHDVTKVWQDHYQHLFSQKYISKEKFRLVRVEAVN
ncbi:hypothetical protein [Jeotgalibacillus malaysiensis]|uniref:hypothetical protein n=1 Tax=Jeotgalibacillus malaysiensis TaxID=1508404 RepID=UPI00384C629C